MGKITIILVCVLVCLSSISITLPDVLKVKAYGGGGGDKGNTLLDFDFIWRVTKELCNVTYKYPEGLIPKGRSFGSWGGNYAAEYIINTSMIDMDLNDVHKEQIKHIEGIETKNYSTIINMTDFRLTINNASDNPYPYENPVLREEMFVLPCGFPPDKSKKLTANFSFTDAKIEANNMTKFKGFWPLAETYNNFSFTSTDFECLKFVSPFIVGNVTYIAPSDTVPSPEEQYGRVFLLDEVSGFPDKLNNITKAQANIIIDSGAIGVENFDASKSYVSVVSINNSDGNTLKELLENYTVLVDNVTGNLTFTYNLNEGWWPSSGADFVVIDRIPDHFELWNITLSEGPFIKTIAGFLGHDKPRITDYITCVILKSIFFRWLNDHKLAKCKGIFLYDSYDYHFMLSPVHFWNSEPPSHYLPLFDYLEYGWLGGGNTVAIPTFTMNYSVGNFLNTYRGNTTVTSYANQTFLEETPSNPGVEAYNIIGNININKSPNNAVAILSNRYDGMWGQTPGDSGVGGAIILGIAKYFKDHNITPKYNLTFLFTTGEEYGLRGIFHYNDSHPYNENNNDNNIKYWFILDQLAWKQSDTALCLYSSDEEYTGIIDAIINQTHYYDRTGYKNLTFGRDAPGSEQSVASSRKNCDTFCIIKDQVYRCDIWHRTGRDYTKGDCLDNTDREDVNITAELVLNISKYFLVDPDCWFSNINYEAIDSHNDGDTLIDSIKANFTINTIIPHDLVMINASLINSSSEETVSNLITNYTVTSAGLQGSISTSIPDADTAGDYSLSLELYNSTGRINEIVDIGTDNCNDTSSSNVFHLYHPLGYIEKGSSSQSVNDQIRGSVFTANENGYADNITAYINLNFMSPGPYKCMLYRANDSKLIGNTTENWTRRDVGENPYSTSDWAVFNFSEPKPVLKQGIQYVITCWGDSAYSLLYCDDFSYPQGRYDNETYGTPPQYANFSNEDRLYSIYCSYTAINYGPNITSVTSDPDTVGFGFDVTISANVTDVDGVDMVKVNIGKPDAEPGAISSYIMTNTAGSIYEYAFNDTWENGQYNYTIWAIDDKGYSNTSSQYSFNVSAMATVSVCTVKDEYGNNTIVNITDPPSNPPQIGYELLDNNKVLKIWNNYDSYYFNTSSGIQLTNHYNEYWSHNVLMLGYYNNDQWNLIYRTDELSGFNKEIDTDNETYVNATLWKDLTYGGYDFRLAIRYHLGVNDNELTVIPYIKNLGQPIPYNLGFAWEINNIQICMTPENDYIEINGTTHILNETLDETYKNMAIPSFYIREDVTDDKSESLYLRWNNSLDYCVKVKSRDGEYNAPVTIAFKIGNLAACISFIPVISRRLITPVPVISRAIC